MKELLRARPEAACVDYSSSHLHKGAVYHDRFSSLPGRALMWDMEQDVIRKCVRHVQPDRVLDFATGTGRIAGFISDVAPDAQVCGVDISASMLAVATECAPKVTFICSDGRRALEQFSASSFDLVTAFRFFANADARLRAAAADQITALVKPSGWLLMNNHRNFWSPTYLLRRLAERGAAHGALNRDVSGMFKVRGFTIVKKFSVGVWPQSENRSVGLPWFVTSLIEQANLALAATHHTAGYNTIWLMRKRENA